ncbi:transglutaminase [Burkholderia sp. SFA1]|uniref:transglutaminase family protein n=1 Tax=unclassified Caballeronia TaxID=2646786 RepID=UPI001F201364|nr:MULTISPECIES: transglutaminase family protein [unclassified Caballeronia]MCE4543863.1 transglutaminase family protein [Caballeronia sp. PC1]MCE4571016.1 transglutaminase family protein [Caballeronia sp. CLC5]BBP99141.1 transglutaminase [Burkholderia sp. SFA1]
MLLIIRHDIRFSYAAPVTYSIQQFRVSPASGSSQLVRHWHVEAPGKLDATRDAYGNALHTLVLTKPHSEMQVSVAGEVETEALADGRLFDEAGPIPLEHFTCATPLTAPDAAIRELADRVPALDTAAALIALMERIAERVRYRIEAAGTAAQALANGCGDARDFAHLMLACCRARGVPARCVSGYLGAHAHAWVDVWIEHGWVSVDATEAAFANERHCRLAVARDYEAAAPVRGARVGGKEATLDVRIDIDARADQ